MEAERKRRRKEVEAGVVAGAEVERKGEKKGKGKRGKGKGGRGKDRGICTGNSMTDRQTDRRRVRGTHGCMDAWRRGKGGLRRGVGGRRNHIEVEGIMWFVWRV